MFKRFFCLGGMLIVLLMVLSACGGNVSSSIVNRGDVLAPTTTPAAPAATPAATQNGGAATTAAATATAAIVPNAGTATTAPVGTRNAGTAVATQNAGTAAAAKCDPPMMVNITNDGNPAYDKKSVNLNMGDTLLINNHTTNTFTLATAPNSGLPYVVVDPNEIEHVQFNQAGTFTLGSQEFPETTIAVVVAAHKGSTCGVKPAATVNFTANNTFSQAAATVPAGQSIQMMNQSANIINLTSTPNLGQLTLHPQEQQIVQFPKAGTYVISPQDFPDQKLTVTVK